MRKLRPRQGESSAVPVCAVRSGAGVGVGETRVQGGRWGPRRGSRSGRLGLRAAGASPWAVTGGRLGGRGSAGWRRREPSGPAAERQGGSAPQAESARAAGAGRRARPRDGPHGCRGGGARGPVRGVLREAVRAAASGSLGRGRRGGGGLQGAQGSETRYHGHGGRAGWAGGQPQLLVWPWAPVASGSHLKRWWLSASSCGLRGEG